ncbi:MAG: FAD/NAD(P)-binding protein [Kiritimatiellia bacterium]
MNAGNLYMPMPARIENIVEETSNIKTFSIKPEEPLAFKAGQFVELTVPGLGEAPFTPSSSPAVTEKMEITIMRVGRVTEKLHSFSGGEEIGVRGPLGQPYPLDEFYGREILIAGGGVGLAPLRALLFALLEEKGKFKKIAVRYGAKTPGDLVYRKSLETAWDSGDVIDLMTTVDKGDAGWTGNEGVVTTILEEDKARCDTKEGVAVVCGPPIMMKFATLKLLDRGYTPERIYLSMEKNMSCGVGKCGHCRIGPYYACKDGPVFSYDRIQNEPKIFD